MSTGRDAGKPWRGDDAGATRAQPSRLVRWFYMGVAAVGLVLAVIGAVLPVMPTVPFILLAAWAASRGSPRLAHWLESHPVFGPSIVAWRAGGVVPRRAKWIASAMMTGSSVGMLLVAGPRWFVLLAVLAMAVAAAWLWRRPER